MGYIGFMSSIRPIRPIRRIRPIKPIRPIVPISLIIQMGLNKSNIYKLEIHIISINKPIF